MALGRRYQTYAMASSRIEAGPPAGEAFPAQHSNLVARRPRVRIVAGAVSLALAALALGTALSAMTGEVANDFRAVQSTARVAEAPVQPLAIRAVDSVGITVSDMDRSLAFFTTVLSFEKVSDLELAGTEYERLFGVFGLRIRVVRMKLGDEFLELMEFLTPRGRPFPPDSRGNDRWFQHIAIIVRDMDDAYRHLRKHKVEHASTGPQRLPDWNKNAAGIQAFYFRDPDGHFLEVLQFPPDKGDPKWRRKTDKLFLGIDHTAIVVGDTDASLRFYRDTLGLKVVGESENYGTEQEHLNNVFGARLRITTLRAPQGPAIEFLEYLTPRDGRPTPHGSQTNDLWHWQIRLVSGDADKAARSFSSRRGHLISPGTAVLPDGQLGYVKALLARDPDGHGLLIAEE
jgi:catechol 2,3-dioxygenase-like lactoylglutathione lyase family enzyme